MTLWLIKRRYHEPGGKFSMKTVGEVRADTHGEAIAAAAGLWPKLAQAIMKNHGFEASQIKAPKAEAAAPVEKPPKPKTIADRVRDFYKEGGIGSADRVAARLKVSVMAVRPRVSELRAKGLIESTGRRARTIEGNTCDEWKWAEPKGQIDG